MDELNIDAQFLDALKSGSQSAFEQLYRRYYRMTENQILQFHGDQNDAKDIFQETLFVLVKKLRDPEFKLVGKLSTFLFAVSRNLWLKKKGKSTREVHFENQDFAVFNLESEAEEATTAVEKEALLDLVGKKLEELEEGCRNLILFSFYQKLPHQEIARLMGYTESFVKVKKFRCLEYLRRLVQDHPIFKNWKL